MLSIPKSLEEKKNILLREFISDVVMSHGNRRFLLMNFQAQIWGVTPKEIPTDFHRKSLYSAGDRASNQSKFPSIFSRV